MSQDSTVAGTGAGVAVVPSPHAMTKAAAVFSQGSLPPVHPAGSLATKVEPHKIEKSKNNKRGCSCCSIPNDGGSSDDDDDEAFMLPFENNPFKPLAPQCPPRCLQHIQSFQYLTSSLPPPTPCDLPTARRLHTTSSPDREIEYMVTKNSASYH